MLLAIPDRAECWPVCGPAAGWSGHAGPDPSAPVHPACYPARPVWRGWMSGGQAVPEFSTHRAGRWKEGLGFSASPAVRLTPARGPEFAQPAGEHSVFPLPRQKKLASTGGSSQSVRSGGSGTGAGCAHGFAYPGRRLRQILWRESGPPCWPVICCGCRRLAGRTRGKPCWLRLLFVPVFPVC